MFQDQNNTNNCYLYVSGPIPQTIIYIFQDQEHPNLICIVKILIFILNGNII